MYYIHTYIYICVRIYLYESTYVYMLLAPGRSRRESPCESVMVSELFREDECVVSDIHICTYILYVIYISYIHMHIYAHICLYIYHIYICIYMQTCIIHIYHIYICIYMHTYIIYIYHIYICIYVHTYIIYIHHHYIHHAAKLIHICDMTHSHI